MSNATNTRPPVHTAPHLRAPFSAPTLQALSSGGLVSPSKVNLGCNCPPILISRRCHPNHRLILSALLFIVSQQKEVRSAISVGLEPGAELKSRSCLSVSVQPSMATCSCLTTRRSNVVRPPPSFQSQPLTLSIPRLRMFGKVARLRVRPVAHITAPVPSQGFRMRNMAAVCWQNRVLLVAYQFSSFYYNIIITPDASVLPSPGPFRR